MNDKFDKLAKGMAQSVTRRAALKQFGLGFSGIALASLGLASKAQANPKACKCHKPYYGCSPSDATCINNCAHYCSGI